MRNMNWLLLENIRKVVVQLQFWYSANPTLLEIENKFESLQKAFLISLNQEEKPLKIWCRIYQTTFAEKVEILQMNLFLMVNILINVTKIELEKPTNITKKKGKRKPYEKLAISDFPPSLCIPREEIIY